MPTPKNEPPLADLLRPVSAKVLPAAARYSSGGKVMSEKVAAMAARNTRRQGKSLGPVRRAKS